MLLMPARVDAPGRFTLDRDLRRIGRAAVRALYDELSLTPKPGLVTLVDKGSHTDMDAGTFMRSLFALRHAFVRFAWLGAQAATFPLLEQCGIEAEATMRRATGGINTHRGSIFMLGLLCAAAGAVRAMGEPMKAARLRSALVFHWGDALRLRAEKVSGLPGGNAARRYGLRGASVEAALGFPVLFETALPAWAACRRRGLSFTQVRLDTLFHVVAVMDDCNLAHRGGLDGLRHAQALAAGFLAAGGSAASSGLEAACAIGDAVVAANLSPGGAADVLAAACWFERVGDELH